MVKMPRVLILMATYNGEKFIREQIDSILNQTYKNWKLVIHDDGSTDSTVEIIKEYTSKYPNKIIFIDDGIRCGGAKENFAHLLNLALTKYEDDFEYIMFSDQDDVWLSNKVEISVSNILEIEKSIGYNAPIIIHTDLEVVDENLNTISNSFWEYQSLNPFRGNTINCLILENTVTGCTMILNKRLAYHVRDIPKEALAHDWWIALVCSALNGFIIPINIKTVLYRQHNFNDIGAKHYGIFSLLYRFIKNPGYFFNKRKKILNQAVKLSELYMQKNSFLKNFYFNFKNPIKRKLFYCLNNCMCSSNHIKKLLQLILL